MDSIPGPLDLTMETLQTSRPFSQKASKCKISSLTQKHDVTVTQETASPDGLDHRQSHVDAVGGVLRPTDRKSADAVVAVAQDLDAHALVLLPQEKGWC